MFAGQDQAPAVHTVHIYIYVYMFVLKGGKSHWPRSLRCPLSLIHPSLSFVAAAGWIVVLRAFSMAEWRASFRLLLTGNALTYWREDRRREEGFLWQTNHALHGRFCFSFHCPDCLSVWHSLSHLRTHCEGDWGNVWTHQLAINNSVILHCVNVYVSLVAELRGSVLY